MRKKSLLSSITTLIFLLVLTGCQQNKTEWISLFNGTDLSGWTVNENPETFKVVDGELVIQGNRSHLFYTGEVNNADFKDFELSLDVKTHYLANSGIYFHTTFQKDGWPEKGYEVQINNSHIGGGDYRELKKTGSLYAIRNMYKTFVPDSTWFHMNIRVQNKHIVVTIDGRVVTDYQEPDHPLRFRAEGQDLFSHGTFAIQGHDPDSRVHIKNIKIKLLDSSPAPAVASNPSYAKIAQKQSQQYAFIDLNRQITESLAVDSTIQSIFATGINLGLVTNLDVETVNAPQVTLRKNFNDFKNKPVFLGMRSSDPTLLQSIPIDLRKQFDYVKGRIPRPETMDDYPLKVIQLIESGIIDIWEYSYADLAWPPDALDRLLKALHTHQVAIEIDVKEKIPGFEFIKQAKESGCKFTTGRIPTLQGVAQVNYILQVIDSCGLGYKDFYIPDKLIQKGK